MIITHVVEVFDFDALLEGPAVVGALGVTLSVHVYWHCKIIEIDHAVEEILTIMVMKAMKKEHCLIMNAQLQSRLMGSNKRLYGSGSLERLSLQ